VSALLSGALLNCAFLGILRVHQICVAAGVGERSADLLVFFGLLSMGLASVFIIQQADFKRMLAYSSVEHMGILALGVGLGGAGAFGALLHSVNHSLTKASLFLTAGLIMMAYRTREIDRVSGTLRVAPAAGVLWIAGFLSITGSPPFGTFLSEFTILKAALDEGRFVVAALYLLFLSLIFIGMANIVLRMAQGTPPEEQRGLRYSESLWMTLPPAVLAALVLLFGLFVPAPLSDLAKRASEYYEVHTPVEQTETGSAEADEHARAGNDFVANADELPASPARRTR
jgi:hydrogenase-4 component F